MLEKVKEYIEQNQLLRKEELALVAVSGGADSVALLLVLKELGYHIEAVHCNFNLRGEESRRDEQFVANLCQRLEVPLHRAHFDTRTYAELHKISIEMAAREMRYRYFDQLASDLNATTVCVAHHRDDNVETLLLNLLRGTGIHGLTGMKPKRLSEQGISIVRPLLSVSRKDIEQWLQQQQQSYVIDSTNLIPDVKRNKLRISIIPLLQSINSSAIENLQSTIDLMVETEKIYDAFNRKKLDEITHTVSSTASFVGGFSPLSSCAVSDLKATPSPLVILYEWLKNFDFTTNVIREISTHLDAPTGRLWQSPTHELCIDRGQLLVYPLEEPFKPMIIPEIGVFISSQLKVSASVSSEVVISREPFKATLDADKVQFPITVRRVAEGDRFVPYGMQGSRLVSDFLTDKKVPLIEKRRQLIVTDGTGKIIWLVGHRIAQPLSITAETRSVLVLEVLTPHTILTPSGTRLQDGRC